MTDEEDDVFPGDEDELPQAPAPQMREAPTVDRKAAHDAFLREQDRIRMAGTAGIRHSPPRPLDAIEAVVFADLNRSFFHLTNREPIEAECMMMAAEARRFADRLGVRLSEQRNRRDPYPDLAVPLMAAQLIARAEAMCDLVRD